MRVRFIGAMPEKGYSGGRLLVLTLANALLNAGIDTDFVTNVLPEMADEFGDDLPILTAALDNFSPLCDRDVDVAIVVPGQGHFDHHGEFLRHALECGAKIVLLNFESPNWFNALSPQPRREALWDGWRLVSAYADMVLSISAEGDHWARDYYKNVTPNCRFRHCHTAINSDLADAVPEPTARERRILMLTRIDGHKGYGALDPLLDERFAGFEVLVCLGMGSMDPQQQAEWTSRLAEFGVQLNVRGPAIGLEKFALIKSSAVLYFPTRFEGFGIPPLEAGYCGTPVACSDLPVLREFGGDAFHYAQPGDTHAMRATLLTAIASGGIAAADRQRLREIGSLQHCGVRLGGILRELL